MTNLELRLKTQNLPVNVVPEVGRKVSGSVIYVPCTASAGDTYNWLGGINNYAVNERVQVYFRAGTIIPERLIVDVPYTQLTDQFTNLFNVSVTPTAGLNPFPTIVKGLVGASRYNSGANSTVSVQFQVSPVTTNVSVTLRKAASNVSSFVEQTKTAVDSFDPTYQKIAGFSDIPAGAYELVYKPQGSTATGVIIPVLVNANFTTDLSNFTYASAVNTEYVYTTISRMVANFDPGNNTIVLRFVATGPVEVQFVRGGTTYTAITYLDIAESPFTKYAGAMIGGTGTVVIRFRAQGGTVWIERTINVPLSQDRVEVYSSVINPTTQIPVDPGTYTPPTTTTFTPLAASTWSGNGEEYIQNSSIKFGVHRDRGGMGFYLSPVGGISRINDPVFGDGRFDVGRQMDVSVYAEPRGGDDPQYWYTAEPPLQSSIGWNGVGPGNTYPYCNSSPVLAFGRNASQIYTKTQPRQWQSDSILCKCYIEKWQWLDGIAVRTHARVTMFRDDSQRFLQRGVQQEVGYAYPTGIYCNLVTCQDSQPFTNAALTREVVFFGDNADGFGTRRESTECWAALVDDNDQGIGWFTADQSGFYPGHFHDKATDPHQFGAAYVTPTWRTVLDATGVYEWDYAILCGSLSQIRTWVYAQPRDYFQLRDIFNNTRHEWSFDGSHDNGISPNGLDIDFSDAGARFKTNYRSLKASLNQKVYIRASFTNMTQIQLLFRLSNQQEGTAEGNGQTKTIGVTSDATFRTYELDMSGMSSYKDIISELTLRVVPGAGASSGRRIRIKGISCVKSDCDNLA